MNSVNWGGEKFRYDINVNKFNNPGYPEIPRPVLIPMRRTALFLAIQINVNPWTWYTQEEEFLRSGL